MPMTSNEKNFKCEVIAGAMHGNDWRVVITVGKLCQSNLRE